MRRHLAGAFLVLSALLLATACGGDDDAATDVPEDTTEVAQDTAIDPSTTESTDAPPAEEPELDACEVLPIAELNEVTGVALVGVTSQRGNCFYGDTNELQQVHLEILLDRDADKIDEEMWEFFGVESEEAGTEVPGLGDRATFMAYGGSNVDQVQINASKGRDFVRINAGALGIGVEEMAALARIVLDRLPT